PAAGRPAPREVFVRLAPPPAVQPRLRRLPAAPLAGALGQAEPAGAVRARPAALARSAGRRYVVHGRVLAQAADHGDARAQGRLEGGGPGVAAVRPPPPRPCPRAGPRRPPSPPPRRPGP